MDVKHSRRILAVGAPDSGVLQVIKDLTGSAPEPHDNGSTAGLTHEWNVETAYYKAKVPIWVDEITDTKAWKHEFLKPEAKEVIEAVGAWIYCFRMPQDGIISQEIESTMKAMSEISEEHAGFGADTVMLAVALQPDSNTSQKLEDAKQDDCEDVCLQYGFEYIDYSTQGKNEFGEKTGFERIKEALEANEWATTAGSDEGDLGLDDLGFDIEDDGSGFTRDEAEMTAELFGMKAALAGEDYEPDADDSVSPNQQASEVEDLDKLMGKLLAVKEQSAHLPEAQRKKMAAKAVRDLMDQHPGVG